jgi:hypothetical protein
MRRVGVGTQLQHYYYCRSIARLCSHQSLALFAWPSAGCRVNLGVCHSQGGSVSDLWLCRLLHSTEILQAVVGRIDCWSIPRPVSCSLPLEEKAQQKALGHSPYDCIVRRPYAKASMIINDDDNDDDAKGLYQMRDIERDLLASSASLTCD